MFRGGPNVSPNPQARQREDVDGTCNGRYLRTIAPAKVPSRLYFQTTLAEHFERFSRGPARRQNYPGTCLGGLAFARP